MRKHTRRGLRIRRAPRAKRPRARSHPVAMILGLLIVIGIATATFFAVKSLYTDFVWQSSAQSAASAVSEAIQDYSARDDSTPRPVDAVESDPAADQVVIDDLPYREDVPSNVARIRISEGGGLSVVTASGALCSGVTVSMTIPSKAATGSFACGQALVPTIPQGLRATPHDGSVGLEWAHPPGPVEDYALSFSANDGLTWADVDDGVSSTSRATVRPLVNGHPYVFRVAALNLVGESAPASASASPFTTPKAPTSVRAIGGFKATVSWSPVVGDGGRPVTAYVVTGDPSGTCTSAPTATRCEVTDLPAAPGYTFTVRAINAAGAGTPSSPTAPVAVYSPPGRPVALTAAPGDGVVLLAWTRPLMDGNTQITDYHVEYRVAGQEEWTALDQPASTQTTKAVEGLVNGTEYEFRVMAVNAAGVSDPPLSQVLQTPATIPGTVTAVEPTTGNATVTLTWTAPLLDGHAEVTDYAVEFHAKGGPWVPFRHPASPALTAVIGGLQNGTPYAFRVAAINRMGRGPWSPRAIGMPVGPPGPVVEPMAVGTLKDITLTWLPPTNDGGRVILGYRIEYKPSAAPDWIRVGRIPSTETTVTVEGLTGGESYDFNILALSRAGVGPATAEGPDLPTLAGVIADETPRAPLGLTAIPGDRSVTLQWLESPAGRKSPIAGYAVTATTVAGDPAGTCATTTRLTCAVDGLTNGVTYAFTVSAANANITGPESAPVTTTPKVFNAATGGIESTYTRNGRTFRVHTFTAGSTFTISSAPQPFTVLIVGAGGGSAAATDGSVAAGGGGGIIDAKRMRLAKGVLNVVVGTGGAPGAAGTESSLDTVGSAPAGQAGSPTPGGGSPTTTSGITGTPVTYGGVGTPTGGPGIDGLGTGGGGPSTNRGGHGVVIVRYEVAG